MLVGNPTAVWAAEPVAGNGPPCTIDSVTVTPVGILSVAVSAISLVSLAGLGAVAAQAGGAPVVRGTLRVAFWGALAMALTAGVGALFGATL